MKTLFFIVPNQLTGGSMSSLSAIYKEFSTKYEFRVFALSRARNSEYPFDDKIIQPGLFFSAFHVNPLTEKGLMRIFVYVVKFIKFICSVLNIDLMKVIYRNHAHKLERKYKPYKVIAFEEAMPTYFGSYFNKSKIAWFHSNYDFYKPILENELEVYKKYDKVICVSNFTSEVFKNHFPTLSNKVDYIYNLLDVERIKRMSLLPIDDSRFKNADITIISAGRIDPIKRFSEIPAIASMLHNRGLNFVWYILGPVAVESEKNKLIENIKKYSVQDRVVWLGGKSNPYNYFANSDVYVCTSESEACPMVFNEAFILGLPVVTTNFGSAIEFVEDGKNGKITIFDEISETLFKLLENKDNINDLKQNVRSSLDLNYKILSKLNCIFE